MPTTFVGLKLWCGRRESNSGLLVGSQTRYPYATPAMLYLFIRYIRLFGPIILYWWVPVVTLHSLLRASFTDPLPKLSALGTQEVHILYTYHLR